LPPLAVAAAFAQLFRRRGWRFSLVTVSVAGNVLFVAVVVAAYLVSHEPSGEKECPGIAKNALPPGFVCKEQGSLSFAEMSSREAAASVFGRTVFVASGGCIVAAFEFDKSGGNVSTANIYDAACRPRLEMDVATGATSYSVYDGSAEPEYSVRDKNGDGIPDVKIEWTSNTSFRRSEPIEWHVVNECEAVGEERKPGSHP
jgi:hypothetical protein